MPAGAESNNSLPDDASQVVLPADDASQVVLPANDASQVVLPADAEPKIPKVESKNSLSKALPEELKRQGIEIIPPIVALARQNLFAADVKTMNETVAWYTDALAKMKEAKAIAAKEGIPWFNRHTVKLLESTTQSVEALVKQWTKEEEKIA